MAISNPETIEIVDESTHDEVRFQLYIDGGRRAFVRKKRGLVALHWEVYGAQQWPEAKVLMQGLLELSVIADQLLGEKNDGRKADHDED
jgi:hypothetical protein